MDLSCAQLIYEDPNIMAECKSKLGFMQVHSEAEIEECVRPWEHEEGREQLITRGIPY